MKKAIHALFALFISGVILAACNSKSGDNSAIKESASAFINAMNKMDLVTARKYVTDSSAPMIDQMIDELKNMPEDQSKMFKEKVAARNNITVTIKDIRTSGDKATVTFTVSDAPSMLDSLPMIKQNGKWLTDFRGL